MTADIKFYYSLILKRLPLMSTIFMICAAIGVALALKLPPRYQAEARLLVESARITDTTTRNNNDETNATDQLRIIQQRLLTRANMIDIARKHKVFAGEVGMSPDDVVSEMRDLAQVKLTAGRTSATVMELAFTAGKAQVAADVVNEFVTLVLGYYSEVVIETANNRLDFFGRQVDRLDRELGEISAEIVAFQEANNDALPDGQNFRLTREAAQQERLNLATRDLASLRDQRTNLEVLGQTSTNDAIALSPELQELEQLRRQLNVDLGTFSEANPRITALRRQIEQLENAVSGQTPDGEPSATASFLEISLAGIDSQIKSAEAEIVGAEAELKILRAAIEKTPQVAIRLEQLERQYENTQSLYNQNVAALAKARTDEQIKTNAQGERVTVMEQAVPPGAPTSPNRKLIAGGGVLAGAGLAAVFFALTELLNPSIRRPVDLTRKLGVQPLATIPFLEDPGSRRRRRVLKAIFLLILGIATSAALWAVHTYYLPLDLLLDSAIDKAGL